MLPEQFRKHVVRAGAWKADIAAWNTVFAAMNQRSTL